MFGDYAAKPIQRLTGIVPARSVMICGMPQPLIAAAEYPIVLWHDRCQVEVGEASRLSFDDVNCLNTLGFVPVEYIGHAARDSKGQGGNLKLGRRESRGLPGNKLGDEVAHLHQCKCFDEGATFVELLQL